MGSSDSAASPTDSASAGPAQTTSQSPVTPSPGTSNTTHAPDEPAPTQGIVHIGPTDVIASPASTVDRDPSGTEYTAHLFPGEALDVPLVGITDVDASFFNEGGIFVFAQGDTISIEADSSYPDGSQVSVDLDLVGCVDGTCGVARTVTVNFDILSFPQRIEDVRPVTAAAPVSMSPTPVPTVAEVGGGYIMVLDPTADPFPIADSVGAVIIGGVPEAHVFQVRVQTDWAPDVLADTPGVLAVTPDIYVESANTATTEATPGDWYDAPLTLDTAGDGDELWWQFSRFGFEQVWGTRRWTQNGTRLAVIDEGIYVDHPDLNVVSQQHYCGEDDTACIESWKRVGSHGTHVAGLACGDDNGVGLTGVAWGCDLVAIDFATTPAVRMTGDTSPRSIVAMLGAMVAAVDSGADVVNISLGWPAPAGPGCADPSPELRSTADTISRVLEAGIDYGTQIRKAEGRPDVIWVAAAGNECVDVENVAPANLAGYLHPNVISVASVDSDGGLSAFSNFGWDITVAAPGGVLMDDINAGSSINDVLDNSVWSSVVECDAADSSADNAPIHPGCSPSWAPMAGTSMAAPIVAGTALLMRDVAPDLPVDDLRQCLGAGASPVTHRNQYADFVLDPDIDWEGTILLLNPSAALECAQRYASTPGWRVIDDRTEGYVFSLRYPVTGRQPLDAAIESWAAAYVDEELLYIQEFAAGENPQTWGGPIVYNQISLVPYYISDEISTFGVNGFVTFGGVGWDPNEPVIFDADGNQVDFFDFIKPAATTPLLENAFAKVVEYEPPMWEGERGASMAYSVGVHGRPVAMAPPEAYAGSSYGSPSFQLDWSSPDVGAAVVPGSPLDAVMRDTTSNRMSPDEIVAAFGDSEYYYYDSLDRAYFEVSQRLYISGCDWCDD